MIEIINPGWFALIGDGGRRGFADIGVPASSVLDHHAFRAANHLTGNPPDAPVIEVMGNEFTLKFGVNVKCAITGARVKAFIDGVHVDPWSSFHAREGSILEVQETIEGFRYYVSFSGIMGLQRVIGSYATNLECRFGGFRGRPLVKGDVLELFDVTATAERALRDEHIPPMNPPHRLRIIEGPEIDHFTKNSIKRFLQEHKDVPFTVSSRLNRTGIRLEGRPLVFKGSVEKSIISEGILPGTIQVPGDGLPIIMLSERTIGGYARVAMVAKVDHDLLAHLKPRDTVLFVLISVNEAELLWQRKEENLSFIGDPTNR
jgi:biotin-dependent carboxylase-like uncharacterized protein